MKEMSKYDYLTQCEKEYDENEISEEELIFAIETMKVCDECGTDKDLNMVIDDECMLCLCDGCKESCKCEEE